jgi:hypothetical protein
VKKLLCVLFLFLVFSVPAIAESASFMTEEEVYQAIHDMFANHTDEELENWIKLANYELEYRKNIKSAVSEVIKDDNYTQKLICNYFENIGLKIKYVMFQPLVEKDPGGLYGGEERWFVTFESGEQIGTWVSNDQITYCYKNKWYNDVPLY